MMDVVKRFFLLTVLALSIFRCGSDPEPDAPVIETYLVSTEPAGDYSFQTLQTLFTLLGLSEFNDLLRYPVQAHRMVYHTTYKGDIIEASGLVFLPVGASEALPLLSLQHGTTFEKDDVPSVSGEFSGVEYFASAGYVAMMPDFIGYGASSSIFHPYYDREHSALAVIDMVKATKEFLNAEEIEFNDKLFITGYSEGGYVSMAAAREIEENSAHGLSTTAVAAGAGGYDLNDMLSYIAGTDTYEYPAYLAFLIMAYNETNEWNRPLTDFFKEEYAEVLDTYLNGDYGGGFINSMLTQSVEELLATEFYDGLTGEGEEQFKDALTANSVGRWDASFPIKLFHGTADKVVPYENSVQTLQAMEDAGTSDITLTLIPGGEHGNSFIPMLIETVPWFEELR